MRNKLTKRIVGGGIASAIGVVVSSLGGAAAAELSPQDRCAIAKLEATWQEAKCLTDAQTRGIRQELTDEQVDRLKADCRQREHMIFENAEGRPGKCKTIDDDAAVDYALKLATDIPRACGESGPPCDAGDPATLSNATLQNKTSHPIHGTVDYFSVIFFCNKGTERFAHGGPNPFTIQPGQIGISDAGICLIGRVRAFMVENGVERLCRDYTSSGTGYRTFQVVPEGAGCLVNRP
jgi:hypothetical protein